MKHVQCCGSKECMKDGFNFHKCLAEINSVGLQEYFPQNVIDYLLGIEGVKEPTFYLDQIIVNYMLGKDEEIDVDKIMSYLKRDDRISFYYTPILIFILEKRYERYFNKKTEV